MMTLLSSLCSIRGYGLICTGSPAVLVFPNRHSAKIYVIKLYLLPNSTYLGKMYFVLGAWDITRAKNYNFHHLEISKEDATTVEFFCQFEPDEDYIHSPPHHIARSVCSRLSSKERGYKLNWFDNKKASVSVLQPFLKSSCFKLKYVCWVTATGIQPSEKKTKYHAISDAPAVVQSIRSSCSVKCAT